MAVKEKKYTEDHEWIEMSADGKTCTFEGALRSPLISEHHKPNHTMNLRKADPLHKALSVSQNTPQKPSETSYTLSFPRPTSRLAKVTQLALSSLSSLRQTSLRLSAALSPRSIRLSRGNQATSTRTPRVRVGLPRSRCQGSQQAS